MDEGWSREVSMGNRRTILIVEDEVVNQKLLKEILKNEYDLVIADNGEEALHVLRNQKNISAILLDLYMPVMDGFEFMKEIYNTRFSACPLIVITGSKDEELEKTVLEKGAWDFVTRPFKREVLLSRVRNAIKRSKIALVENMRYLEQFDSLTGLYKKNRFEEVAGDLIKGSDDLKYAIAYLDINRFSLINSFFGIKTGDKLLKFIASMLRDELGQTDRCAFGRLHSDKFIFCMHYEETSEIEEVIYHMLKKLITYPLRFSIVLSAGIYLVEDREMPVYRMIDNAKLAVDSIKGSFLHNIAYYKSSMGDTLVVNQELLNDLDRAFKNEEFQVYLQPKYNINNNRQTGAEALVRWFHPDKGMISPGIFIPLFEQNGIITELDSYMWDHTCRILRKWIDEGLEPAPLSVNVSRISMFDPELANVLDALIKKYDLPPSLLNLEITESAYMEDPELMKKVIKELHSKGFIILMDDFGSGYSSLNTLKDFDVDILKLDMKFLQSHDDNVKGEKILASVARMAGWLGMPVVVEGVEKKSQVEFLKEIGCGYVQGFYYAKPMPVSEYEKLLRQDVGDKISLDQSKQDEFDDIWFSHGSMSAVMKSITMPFAILEYAHGTCEVIRANEMYQNVFFLDHLRGPFDVELLPHDELQKIEGAFHMATETRNSAECECMYLFPNGVTSWFRVRVQYVKPLTTGHIVCATFANITQEKELNSIVNRISEAFSVPRVKEKKTILIVEDSPISEGIISQVFREDFNILTAGNGLDALDILHDKNNHVSLILLDLIMPKMNGEEFLIEKNKDHSISDIPVIIISVDNSFDKQKEMLKYGVVDYLSKPFVPDMIRKKVELVLEYNDRFHEIIREYRRLDEKNVLSGDHDNHCYTVSEIRFLMVYLQQIFEVVRIVDPKSRCKMLITEDDQLIQSETPCYSIWGRDKSCCNCSSQKAVEEAGQCCKVEANCEGVYYVISTELSIYHEGCDMEEMKYCLEIAKKISNRTEDMDQLKELIIDK